MTPSSSNRAPGRVIASRGRSFRSTAERLGVDSGFAGRGIERAGPPAVRAGRGADRARGREALASPAVRAEPTIGGREVDVSFGVLEEPGAPVLAGAEEEVVLIQDAQARLAGEDFPTVDLGDRAAAAV